MPLKTIRNRFRTWTKSGPVWALDQRYEHLSTSSCLLIQIDEITQSYELFHEMNKFISGSMRYIISCCQWEGRPWAKAKELHMFVVWHSQCWRTQNAPIESGGSPGRQPLNMSLSLAMAEFSVKSSTLFMRRRVFEACSHICYLTDNKWLIIDFKISQFFLWIVWMDESSPILNIMFSVSAIF